MGNASVGGSKDVSHFTGCMSSNQMPDIASLTYEGLYYDYYFQTKNNDQEQKNDHLINPTYSCAKTRIPKAISMLKSINKRKENYNKELKALFQTFKQMDTDNDGFITKEAFINSQVFKNNPLSTNALDDIIDAQKIDFSEFVECIPASKFSEKKQAVINNDCDDNKDAFEYYMTIGLNSTIDSNNLTRNKLNCVVVLDNSGSMSSQFKSATKRELPPQCPVCNKFIKVNNNVPASVDLMVGQHMDANCNTLAVDEDEQLKLEQLQKTEQKCVMDVANQSVLSLLQQLNDEDRFGLVVFNSKCSVFQSLQKMKDINVNKLKTDIVDIKAGGGTNMELAYKTATKLYDDFFAKQKDIISEDDEAYIKNMYPSPSGHSGDDEKEGIILDEYWNRIIFITDALPNSGKCDAETIMNLIQQNSDGTKVSDIKRMESNQNNNSEADVLEEVNEEDMNHIYTTFIGVGLDMNSTLIDEITRVRGCNYCSVHSNDEFMDKMCNEFKFIVTPIAFDFKLSLKTEGNGMCIDKVFGSGDDNKNEEDEEFGFEVMNVSTLFPSPYNESKEIKGGIVLLKLKTNKNNDIVHNMEIDVSYKEVATGKIFNDKQNILFGERNKNKNDNKDYFDHVGIQKAVLLTRYVQLLKHWMVNDQKNNEKGNLLHVSQEFKQIFATFIVYFKEEMEYINDPVLQKEVLLMQKLVDC